MLSLPRPRSSKLTTRAPSLLTLEVAAWNFGAPAQAAVASAKTATSVAVVTAILRKDARMVLPSVGVRARVGAGARAAGSFRSVLGHQPSRGGACRLQSAEKVSPQRRRSPLSPQASTLPHQTKLLNRPTSDTSLRHGVGGHYVDQAPGVSAVRVARAPTAAPCPDHPLVCGGPVLRPPPRPGVRFQSAPRSSAFRSSSSCSACCIRGRPGRGGAEASDVTPGRPPAAVPDGRTP